MVLVTMDIPIQGYLKAHSMKNLHNAVKYINDSRVLCKSLVEAYYNVWLFMIFIRIIVCTYICIEYIYVYMKIASIFLLRLLSQWKIMKTPEFCKNLQFI